MLFSKKNALPASFYYMALKSKTASQRKKKQEFRQHLLQQEYTTAILYY